MFKTNTDRIRRAVHQRQSEFRIAVTDSVTGEKRFDLRGIGLSRHQRSHAAEIPGVREAQMMVVPLVGSILTCGRDRVSESPHVGDLKMQAQTGSVNVVRVWDSIISIG